ncbi:MAG: DUF3798 domain-containing protein [Planctomycetota bacterium]|nr:DUF3798 domain-containing protein [Planctomycetota bacterium]
MRATSRSLACLAVVLCFTFGFASAAIAQKAPDEKPVKIGIVTGTVSQGEEEYRAGEYAVKKYGSDRIIHVTYPDNFMVEQEAVISQIAMLGDNKDVKAIIICQAVPGTVAAIQRVKKFRPDIVFLLCIPHEDPAMVVKYGDIILSTDDLARGETIIELAVKMGAKTFVHYSFPRHMSQDLLARRRNLMKEACGKKGIAFVDATAPDPMGDSGIPGAQQFILEDVPRKVTQYGKDTAFFSTNCAMQEPLIRAVLQTKAIFPEQCCPSPLHGYPGALAIEITDEEKGNIESITKKIKDKITAEGASGRFATWAAPMNMVFVAAAVELAFAKLNRSLDFKKLDAVKEVIDTAAGLKTIIKCYETEQKGPNDTVIKSEKKNFYLVELESIIF